LIVKQINSFTQVRQTMTMKTKRYDLEFFLLEFICVMKTNYTKTVPCKAENLFYFLFF
jgi:hypothetical protein